MRDKWRIKSGIQEAIILAGSQENLGKLLKVTKQTIQRWAQQGYAPTNKVKIISDTYRIPPERLCNPSFLEEEESEKEEES